MDDIAGSDSDAVEKEKYGRYDVHAATNSSICGLRRVTIYSSRMPPPGTWEDAEPNVPPPKGRAPKPKPVENDGAGLLLPSPPVLFQDDGPGCENGELEYG